MSAPIKELFTLPLEKNEIAFIYFGYSGVIIRAKDRTIALDLGKKGISDELLNQVHAPIGLNIGTETPGEIAVAIVAEMQTVLHSIKEVKSCTELI